MVVRLDKLPKDIPGEVVRVRGSMRRWLTDFGLLPGETVMIRYCSPGGVIVLEYRDTVIVLRGRDLKGVRVRWSPHKKTAAAVSLPPLCDDFRAPAP